MPTTSSRPLDDGWLSRPVRVRPRGSGPVSLVPLDPPPPELARLAASPDGLCEARPGRDGRATVKLGVAALLGEARRILLDLPVTLRLDDGALSLEEDDLAELGRRRAAFDRAPRRPAEPAAFGLLRQQSRRLLDGAALASLGWAGADYDPAARALVAPDAPPDPEGGIAALLFYDTALRDGFSLKVEITTKCNFRCGFCYGRHVKQGTVAPSQVCGLLDRFPEVRDLEIIGEGESLLLPELPDLVAAATARGIYVRLGTNGSLLTPSLSRRLIEAGLDELAVSLETLDPERFTQIRAKGDLAAILRSLGAFVALKDELGRVVTVKLWMTVLRESLHQVEAVEALARRLGLAGVEYQTLNTLDQYAQFYDDELKANRLTPRDLREARAGAGPVLGGVIDGLLQVKSSKRCLAPSEMIRVGWQGEVTPCCILQPPSFTSFGNVYGESWTDIADRERYRLFRFATLHGIVLDPCRSCPEIAAPAIADR